MHCACCERRNHLPVKRPLKITIFVLLGLVAVLVVGAGILVGPYYFRVQHFTADPSAGYHADFYLYVSPAAKRAGREGGQVTILVQPNNSGTHSDDVNLHRKDAWWTGCERYRIANELGVVLLVPAFVRPGTDWHIYTHALDRDALTTTRTDLMRVDLQLIAMIDHARATLLAEGIEADARVAIMGFSASGMFANRFTLLHPDRVKVAAIGSPGGWPVAPVRSFNGVDLPYPAGIADLEELTGVAFDSVAYSAIPQMIYVGSLDDNDSLDFKDGWEPELAARVDSLFGADPQARWEHAQALYAGVTKAVTFVRVEGVAHERKKLQKMAVGFVKR